MSSRALALRSGKVVEKAVRGGCREVECGFGFGGWPRPILRSVRRCGGRERGGGGGASGGCRGGKGAARKASVEGDVREGEEG